MVNHFILPGRTKMRLGRVQESDISIGRLALGTHFLFPGLLKMLLGLGRDNYISMDRRP
jgi:hypothetical protein